MGTGTGFWSRLTDLWKRDRSAPAKGAREPITQEREPDRDDVDEMSEQSFPTSDPPSTWAGKDAR